VALLLLAGGAVLAAVAIAFGGRGGGDSGVRYSCPMHAEVRTAAPGECPICRMALEPVGRVPGAGAMAHRAMPGIGDLTAVENVRRHRIICFPRRRSLPASIRELRGPAFTDGERVLDAIFYNDQIASLAADQRGTFSLGRAPATTFPVQRTADPTVPWDRSTSRVRFRLDAAAPADAKAALVPGVVGWIEIEGKARDVLTVPAAAILQSPAGPYVLAWAGGGQFDKRPIEIGETFLKQGFAVVLSGLQPQDRVVSKAAFFLDADRRLGEGAETPRDDLRDDPQEELKEEPKDDSKTDRQAPP
jgi:hypothetical protein